MAHQEASPAEEEALAAAEELLERLEESEAIRTGMQKEIDELMQRNADLEQDVQDLSESLHLAATQLADAENKQAIEELHREQAEAIAKKESARAARAEGRLDRAHRKLRKVLRDRQAAFEEINILQTALEQGDNKSAIVHDREILDKSALAINHREPYEGSIGTASPLTALRTFENFDNAFELEMETISKPDELLNVASQNKSYHNRVLCDSPRLIPPLRPVNETDDAHVGDGAKDSHTNVNQENEILDEDDINLPILPIKPWSLRNRNPDLSSSSSSKAELYRIRGDNVRPREQDNSDSEENHGNSSDDDESDNDSRVENDETALQTIDEGEDESDGIDDASETVKDPVQVLCEDLWGERSRRAKRLAQVRIQGGDMDTFSYHSSDEDEDDKEEVHLHRKRAEKLRPNQVDASIPFETAVRPPQAPPGTAIPWTPPATVINRNKPKNRPGKWLQQLDWDDL